MVLCSVGNAALQEFFSPIDITSMPNAYQLDNEGTVIYVVDDALVALTNAIRGIVG